MDGYASDVRNLRTSSFQCIHARTLNNANVHVGAYTNKPHANQYACTSIINPREINSTVYAARHEMA